MDFGRGFYVTPLFEQAAKWCGKFKRRGKNGIISRYEYDENQEMELKTLKFDSYSEEWLDFIVKSRDGKKPWKDYDYVEGGIADDRVITTIEDYLNGDISMEYALKRLSEHQPNNQICIISQEILDKSLHFLKAEPLNDLARKEASLC